MAKEKKGVGLLKYLHFAGEARADGKVSENIEGGRFRYFGSVFRRRNGALMLINLLFLVTTLPLLALLVAAAIIGTESLGYMLHNVTDLPYFLSGVGFGLSSSSDVLAAKIDMLDVYSLMFLICGVAVIFVGIGLAGYLPVCMKFIWNDSFITKKDSYGNDVPRVVVEFFKGIKKYWWQMLIATAMLGFLIAAVGNSFVFFIGRYWQGNAGAGEWILIIAASVIAILGTMFILLLLPTIVGYDISFANKMRNAAILTLDRFVTNFFLLLLVAVPVVLISVTSGFLNVLFVALVLVFGAPFYGLTLCNYSQCLSERILTPVYVAMNSRSAKKKKKQPKSGK